MAAYSKKKTDTPIHQNTGKPIAAGKHSNATSDGEQTRPAKKLKPGASGKDKPETAADKKKSTKQSPRKQTSGKKKSTGTKIQRRSAYSA